MDTGVGVGQDRPGCSTCFATLCTSPFCAPCPVQGMTSSRRSSQSLPAWGLMLQGKLLVRAADFFPHSHWHFNSTSDPKVDSFSSGPINVSISVWHAGQIRRWDSEITHRDSGQTSAAFHPVSFHAHLKLFLGGDLFWKHRHFFLIHMINTTNV